jgi:hypothetical protein
MSQHVVNSINKQYADLKPQVDMRFPVGQFVAVEAGSVVVDAQSHRELVEKLRSLGKSPRDMLIFQAGVEYPDSATILCDSFGLTVHA